MSTIRIDDRSSSVTYSQPASGHHWTSQGSSTSNANTLSLTRTRNAFASVTFTGACREFVSALKLSGPWLISFRLAGSSIAVYGLISDSAVSDVAPASSYTIDGGTTYTYTATQTSSVQSQVLFFKSDSLSNGQHTLVITNLAEGDFFWLDYFDVTPNTSVAPTTTTTTKDNGQDSTSIIIQTLTTTFADASTTRTAVSTSVSTSVVSHSFVNSVSSSTPTGQDHLAPTSTTQPEKKTPVGAIAGGIVGGIFLIIIVLSLLVCLKRRRKRAEGGIKLETPSGKRGSISKYAILTNKLRQAWLPPRNGIVPFGVPAESLNPTSQPNIASSSSITSYPYGGFNQQNMVSGRSAMTYGQVHPLPPAVPQGKRQVIMPNDYSSTTGLVNAQQMEQDQIRAHASSPSSSSGITNFSRGWTVAGSTGIAHSGSSSVGGLYGGIQEDSPPAYQANTGEGAGVSNHLATTRKQ